MECANQLQTRGLSRFAAIREASLTRLRPVLRTSAATIFGHFPLVLATGPEAATRNSIGMMLVTGMTVGTIFTLFVVPVFHSLIAAQHYLAQSGAALEDVESVKLTLAGTGSLTGFLDSLSTLFHFKFEQSIMERTHGPPRGAQECTATT